MAVFLVTYDLVAEKSAHDYKPLLDSLKKLGAVRTHLSEWLVALDCTAKVALEYFLQHIDSNDRLMVIKVTERPGWNVGLKGTQTFIDAHFPI